MDNDIVPKFGGDDDLLNINIADIELKPQVYIHYALYNAIRSLTEDPQSGSWKFKQQMNFIESIARASDMIPKNYDTLMEQFAKDNQLDKETDNVKKLMMVGRYQSELILGSLFKGTIIKDPVKVK